LTIFNPKWFGIWDSRFISIMSFIGYHMSADSDATNGADTNRSYGSVAGHAVGIVVEILDSR